MLTIDDLILFAVAALLLAIAAVRFAKKKNYPRWTRIVGNSAIAVLTLAAICLALGEYFLAGEYHAGRELGLEADYSSAINRAVFMDKTSRAKGFDVPGVVSHSPLCQPAMLADARQHVADGQKSSCAIVKWQGVGMAEVGCEGMRRQDCISFVIDPTLYSDVDVHPLIVSALTEPCQFFWPTDVLKPQLILFLEATKEESSSSEKWKQDNVGFSQVAAQLQARRDFDCDVPKHRERAVVISFGDQKDILKVPGVKDPGFPHLTNDFPPK